MNDAVRLVPIIYFHSPDGSKVDGQPRWYRLRMRRVPTYQHDSRSASCDGGGGGTGSHFDGSDGGTPGRQKGELQPQPPPVPESTGPEVPLGGGKQSSTSGCVRDAARSGDGNSHFDDVSTLVSER